MPRSSDVLYLAEVVVAKLIVAAIVLTAQVDNAVAVGIGKTLSNRALGDVAAYVLLVVGLLLGAFDFTGHIEDANLLLFGLVKVKDELLTGFLGSLLLLDKKVLFTRPVPIGRCVEELLHRVGGAQLELGQGRANQERRTTHVKERFHAPDGSKRNEILSLGASGCRCLRMSGDYRGISLINRLVNTDSRGGTRSIGMVEDEKASLYDSINSPNRVITKTIAKINKEFGVVEHDILLNQI